MPDRASSPLPSPLRPPWTASPLQVWAVEDRSLQLTWGSLPAGGLRVTAHRAEVVPRKGSAPLAEVSVEHPGGPGALELDGLTPATPLRVDVRWPGGATTLMTVTLAGPPGPELFRFATVSDLHIGARKWGFLKTMDEVDPPADADRYPLRCARAAIADAAGWGAELLVIKGDLVEHRHPEHFRQAGALLDEFEDLPMLLVPGNHDVDRRSGMDLPLLGRRRLAYTTEPVAHEVPGLSVLLADTSIVGQSHGTLGPAADALADLARDARNPAFVALHHHFHRYDAMTHWPPGIAKDEADAFFTSLRGANPRSLVSSGHSHRNRRRTHHGIPFAEVASTKDWPGVWAGYVVHEGGIRQVVRRVVGMVDWHEYSRGAVLGLWGLWAPGRLSDRCFTLDWHEA